MHFRITESVQLPTGTFKFNDEAGNKITDSEHHKIPLIASYE